MKKLIVLLCVTVLSFTLTACGGSSDPAKAPTPSTAPTSTKAPTSTPTPTPISTPSPTPEVSLYDEAKQVILDHIDVAYTGLTPAKAPMYFLADNEGEYVVLLLENKDRKSYIMYDGGAVIDEDSGIITVTDDETGYSFGFIAKEQSNGSFFLDCGNLGEAYLQADEPGDVVDNILATFQTMYDATEQFMEAVAKLNFIDSLDEAYTGLTANETPMFFLSSSDGEFAALVMVSPNGEDYISFVGEIYVDEDSGVFTIIDSEKGYWIGFTAQEQSDGTFLLDCGNLGKCYLEPDETLNVVNYIETIYQEMNDVTDAFIAEITE